jgi:hypothetical protein
MPGCASSRLRTAAVAGVLVVAVATPLVEMLCGPVVAPAFAEMPDAGLREQQWSLADANRSFEAGRFDQALAAFEAASRDADVPLPADALRRWGIAAAESGWQLTAYLRLRQFLDRAPPAPDRTALEGRVERALGGLLERAVKRSRVVVFAGSRSSADVPAERHVLRVAARDGRVTLEGVSGGRVQSTVWEGAREAPVTAYLDLVRRLLDARAFRVDVPSQGLDPGVPGLRRAAALRLVIGDEERSLQALRGSAYEDLAELVAVVFDFARGVAMLP